jgi:hypothetical protein
MSVSHSSNHRDIVKLARAMYGNTEIRLYSDPSIKKRSAAAIPSVTKQEANQARDLFEKAIETLEQSKINMKINVDQYNKLNSENPEAIKKSKPVFEESSKNNKDKFVGAINNIKSGIKLLEENKDATTTNKYIESITQSSVTCSESLESLFDSINQIETPDFLNHLTQKTTEYDKFCTDLIDSLNSAKKYIDRDILNEISLTNT